MHTSPKFIVISTKFKNSHRAAQELERRAASRLGRKFSGPWCKFRLSGPDHRFCIGFPLKKYLFFWGKIKKIQIRKISKNRFLQNRCRSSRDVPTAAECPETRLPRLRAYFPQHDAAEACVHAAKAHGDAGEEVITKSIQNFRKSRSENIFLESQNVKNLIFSKWK